MPREKRPSKSELSIMAQALGRKGGQGLTPAKRAAILANLAKAQAKRWPGRQGATRQDGTP